MSLFQAILSCSSVEHFPSGEHRGVVHTSMYMYVYYYCSIYMHMYVCYVSMQVFTDSVFHLSKSTCMYATTVVYTCTCMYVMCLHCMQVFTDCLCFPPVQKCVGEVGQ